MFILLSTVIFKIKDCKKTTLPIFRQGCFFDAERLATTKERTTPKAWDGIFRLSKYGCDYSFTAPIEIPLVKYF